MAGVLLQTRLGHVLATSLLLYVVCVRKCLRLLGIHRADIGHVVGRHVSLGRHAGSALLGRQVGARGLFGRVDRIRVVHAIVGRRGLGGVQACLESALEKGSMATKAPSSSYLNQVLSLSLCYERLQLGSGKGVDQTGLGDNE